MWLSMMAKQQASMMSLQQPDFRRRNLPLQTTGNRRAVNRLTRRLID